MKKISHAKWLMTAVFLCAGARQGFADSFLINPVDVAKNAVAKFNEKTHMTEAEVNKLGEEMDQNRDGSARGNSGDLTHEEAVTAQQKNLAVYWNTQKNIQTLLPKAQQARDATVSYAAGHPSDKEAQVKAQEALNAYNKLVNWGNNNGNRIWNSTNNLRGQDPGTTYPDAPNKIEPVKLPLPKASGPSGAGGDASNQTKNDDGSTAGGNNLQDDLNSSYNTEKNIDKLMPLAQKWAQMAADNAKANPDDPVAQANAENAQADLNKLLAMQKNNSNRITDDLQQKYPADDSKPADHAQNAPPEYPGGGDPISELIGPGGLGGGLVMAPNQDQNATQDFVNALSGNNGADGQPSNQTKDIARDNAKDIARDATREAANTAREHARPSTDSMRNCPDGH